VPRRVPARSRRLLLAGAILTLAGCAGGAAESPAGAEVAWRAYGPEAFAEAARAGRPVLIHVVAGWCHWCHVMDDRTYGDARVAARIRAAFVPVRVDSDARPDLGERYRRWGWPATVILTPDARPVLRRRGFVPPERFLRLLERALEAVADGRVPLEPDPHAAEPAPGGADDLRAARGGVMAQLDGMYDPETEGWGRGRQKYPWAAPIEHAFDRARLRGEVAWRERALATLAAQEALFDPAWGGVYQYSDDGTWTSPHYEKVPRVQAGAIRAYARAYRETGDARWLARARDVQGFLVDLLRGPDGSFAASMDADPPAAAGVSADAYFALGDAERRALGLPRVDRAVYADVNGWFVRALCALHRASGDAAALEQAVAAAEQVHATHRLRDGAYAHAAVEPDDVAAEPIYLRDQVALGRAFLALYLETAEARWLERSLAVARVLRDELADPRGGFRARTPDPDAVGVFAEPRRPFQENAAAARLLLRLAAITGDDAWGELATAALRVQADPAVYREWGRIVGELLLALEERAAGLLVLKVAAADPADSRARALREAARAVATPGTLVVPAEAPAGAEPAVLACVAAACAPPITDPARLADEVAAFLEASGARR